MTDNVSLKDGSATTFVVKTKDTGAGHVPFHMEVGNPVTYTYRGGTITTGGTAQNCAPTNATRQGLILQNLSSNDLFVSFTGVANTSSGLRLLPNVAPFSMPMHGVPSSNVSIIGATTGQAFLCYEW